MIRVVQRAAIVLVVLALAAPARGHALATTTVSVIETRAGLIDVTLEAEADALIAKLEALSGTSASNTTTIEQRRARLESLFPMLRAHIDARVSGTPLELGLRDILVDETAQVAIHLAARTPAGPHTFTWRSTFVFGAYQVTIKSGGRADAVQWVQGPQTSDPIALEPSTADAGSAADTTAFAQRLFNNRVGHGLAMGALVLFMLGRRRRGQRLAGG
jgi:hypothetical protein